MIGGKAGKVKSVSFLMAREGRKETWGELRRAWNCALEKRERSG